MTYEARKWQLEHQQVCCALVLSDLAQGDGAGAVAVRFGAGDGVASWIYNSTVSTVPLIHALDLRAQMVCSVSFGAK